MQRKLDTLRSGDSTDDDDGQQLMVEENVDRGANHYHGYGRPVQSNLGYVLECSRNDTKHSIQFIHSKMRESNAYDTRPSDPFVMQSNCMQVTLRFAIKHFRVLLNSVVSDFGTFQLTPAQRLAAAMLLRPIDVPRRTIVKAPSNPSDLRLAMQMCGHERERRLGSDGVYRDVEREDKINGPVLYKTVVNMCIREGTLPNMLFCNPATGTGKTAITIAAVLSAICDDDNYERLVKTYRDNTSAVARGVYTGIEETKCDDEVIVKQLARAAVFLVPEGVITQWKVHLESVRKAAMTKYGKNIKIWAEESRRTAKSAQERSMKLALESPDPVFWVMSEQNRCQRLLKEYRSSIDYAVCVMDEQTAKSGTRQNPYNIFSQPVTSILTQATLGHLSRFDMSSHHPVTYVFGGTYQSTYKSGYYDTNRAARCCTLVHMCSFPDWLTETVFSSVVDKMPLGCHMHSIALRADTIQSRLYNCDLIEVPLAEIFKVQVTAGNSIPSYSTSVSGSVMTVLDALMNDAKKLLGKSKSVSQRFVDFLRSWVEEHDNDWVQNTFVPSFQRLEWMTDVQFEREKTATVGWVERLKSKVQTFRETALSCVDETQVVECAVSLDEIPIERRVIINCCFKVVDREMIFELLKRDSSQQKCPYCRKRFSSLKVSSAAQPSSSSSSSSNSTSDQARIRNEIYESLFTDLSLEAVKAQFDHLPLNDRIGASIQWFREKVSRRPPGTSEGIAALLTLASHIKPDVRALVIVKDPPVLQDRAYARSQMLEKFVSKLPLNFNVALIDGTMKAIKKADDYKDPKNKNPHVLFLFLNSDGKSTVSGMDLSMTDITFFETSQSGGDGLVQAAGRCLRTSSSSQPTYKHLVTIK